jgi:DNA-binding response OmpR family regulator
MSQKKILIVEDNSGTMNLLNQIVQRAGYQSILARGGQEALDLLQAGKVDLILLDIMMRDVNGWTVLKTIKEDAILCDVPVIIVSAMAPSEHPPQIEAHTGMYEDYFVKPFEIDVLVASIAKALSQSAATLG